MDLKTTPLEGVFVAFSNPYEDSRGRFCRLFCQSSLNAANQARPIVQINQSVTRKVGAIRGLHYQAPPSAEAKWVRCLKGRVWDVALDVRRGSSTFLQWQAVELSAALGNMVFLPEGLAHGFQVMEENSELLYLHSNYHSPEHERAIRWDDPRAAINWPLHVTDLSERDKSHPYMDETFEGVSI
jgi:dTDP-4-dehydrorhamnose 3,5-epimerase